MEILFIYLVLLHDTTLFSCLTLLEYNNGTSTEIIARVINTGTFSTLGIGYEEGYQIQKL